MFCLRLLNKDLMQNACRLTTQFSLTLIILFGIHMFWEGEVHPHFGVQPTVSLCSRQLVHVSM